MTQFRYYGKGVIKKCLENNQLNVLRCRKPACSVLLESTAGADIFNQQSIHTALKRPATTLPHCMVLKLSPQESLVINTAIIHDLKFQYKPTNLKFKPLNNTLQYEERLIKLIILNFQVRKVDTEVAKTSKKYHLTGIVHSPKCFHCRMTKHDKRLNQDECFFFMIILT